MDISVLIPLSHSVEHAQGCLESLESTLPARCQCEVIVAEDAAVGTPRELMDAFGRSKLRPRLLRAEGRRGRAAGVNAAAAVAQARLFCLLDPGTTLLPGWLEPMRRLARREADAGCIGNIHREPYSGLIDHDGIGFDADGMPVNAGENAALLPEEASARRAAVSAACCLVSREVFARAGGFDERFRGRFDDVDFCLRAAETGARHYVANRSAVYHYPVKGPIEEADLGLYRARWGERAAAFHRAKIVREADGRYTPERWEAGRKRERWQRREVHKVRADGRRYLRKHLLRPWRYNYGRICRALVQGFQPMPAMIPRLPALTPADPAEAADRAAIERETALFDPWPQ